MQSEEVAASRRTLQPSMPCCLWQMNLMASGDDEGCVKLWDPRQASEASACFSEHTDFIADFAYQVLKQPRAGASAR